MPSAASWYRHHLLDYEVKKDIKNTGAKRGDLVLDYGAGYGDRLRHFENHGLAAMGYEPFFQFSSRLKEKIFTDRGRMLRDMEDNSLDMLQFNHVLGHMHDLAQINEVLNKLKPGRWLVLRTPICDSIQASLFGPRWQAIDPPRTLHFFSAQSLKTWPAACGLQFRRFDFNFSLIHPPTMVLSMFPTLDPLKPGSPTISFIKHFIWGILTIAAGPLVKIESLLRKTSVVTAYFQKK